MASHESRSALERARTRRRRQAARETVNQRPSQETLSYLFPSASFFRGEHYDLPPPTRQFRLQPFLPSCRERTLARRLAPCCATARFRRMRAERATAPTAVGRPRALSCAPCCGVGQGMPHDGQPTRCIGSGDKGRCEEAARALHWPLDGAPPHALSCWPTGGACQEARRSAGHTHRASSGAVAPRSSLRLAPTGCGRAPAARFRRRPAASALSGPRAARMRHEMWPCMQARCGDCARDEAGPADERERREPGVRLIGARVRSVAASRAAAARPSVLRLHSGCEWPCGLSFRRNVRPK